MRRPDVNVMRAIARLAAALVLSLSAVRAAAAVPMGADEARHLLVRTTFAASSADIQAYARLTRAQAVDKLLSSARVEPATRPAPELDAWTPRSRIRAMTEQERRDFIRHTIQQGQELRGWWFNEMRLTASPFTERMTLVWHNHFVSSLQKVRPTRLMYRQNLLLRRHALGNFGELLHAVARDPAMIVYLDIASNRKGSPNENFARELMELFTLGEGHYGEHDVKEAARAFTGWSVDGETGAYLFRQAVHDEGEKHVLGRRGLFGGGDVIDILLAHPQTARRVIGKLWREFVSPAPDAVEVERIADAFRRSRYDIAVAMRALLTSDAFFAPANRASLVKSPIDLLVGTLRTFNFEVGDPFPFVVTARSLGQDVLAPPNVKGWPGGEAWINASTLLARKQILERLLRDSDAPAAAAMRPTAASGATPQALARARFQAGMAAVRFDAATWFAQLPADGAADVAAVLLPIKPVGAIDAAAQEVELIRQLVLDPVYQLK